MPRRTPANVRMRQMLDWSAAIWSGLIAGAVFLVLTVFVLPFFIGADPWLVLRMTASIVLGDSVLTPGASAQFVSVIAAAIGTHLVFSVVAGIVIAYCIHRGGLLSGLIGGGLLGAAIYALNFYGLTMFFPQFFAFSGAFLLIAHIIFGSLAGGMYESLEVEEFEPVAVEPEMAR